MKKIAIIGTGLAGLTLATQLRERAHITLFEKARGVGGRLSTRYTPVYEFDHGAQYFTVKNKAFQAFTDKLLAARVIQRWEPLIAKFSDRNILKFSSWDKSLPHYVGIPRMNAIAKYLAQPHDVKLNTHITKLKRINHAWTLESDQALHFDNYDWVICTAPAAQAAMLMPVFFKHMSILQNIKMQPCFAMMLGFKTPFELPWQAAIVKNNMISWMSVNSCKPMRQPAATLVALSSNQWANEHEDITTDWITTTMLDEVIQLTQLDRQQIDYLNLHRWRYANMSKFMLTYPLIDVTNQLAACGDWCISGRIESSYLAATRLASALIDLL